MKKDLSEIAASGWSN